MHGNAVPSICMFKVKEQDKDNFLGWTPAYPLRWQALIKCSRQQGRDDESDSKGKNVLMKFLMCRLDFWP
jgi:hypothetical protein